MSRHLLDINTLLALLDPLHVFHDAAHRWVATTPDLRFVTCPLVQNGVIRIASQSTYPNTLGSTAEVHAVLAHFCADPRHEFCPDDISLLDLRSSHSRRSRARRAPSPRSDRSMTLRGGGSVHKIEDLPTPCLLLDPIRMQRNIDRLQAHLTRLGVTLRPHLKTCKSLEIARLLMPTPAGPATVSTLQEAEQFAAAGVRDILYAVGIAPNKLARVLALRRAGVDLSVILDSPEQAHAVAAASREARDRIPALIEIDADGHRAGLRPGDPRLLEIGRILDEGGAELRGVMTHAGGSYDHPGAEALTAAAEQERAAVVQCAEALRDAGLPCPVVSVGSTPTAHFARDLTGVTEVRAGVYVFHDLVMAGLGVCNLDDIAISVLATVIGHQPEKGWILTDAGWMAMSRDRGTANQPVDQGYGLVCDLQGQPYPDLILVRATQEHGALALREGSTETLPDLPVGALVRLLPNHACATAAQHDRYHLLSGDGKRITDVWSRFGGW